MNNQINKTPTNILRTLAILLIINSHIDALVPIPYISTGGSLGNAMFFALSGYGLVRSQFVKNLNLLKWLKRRLARIYVPLTIFNLLMFIPLSVYDQRIEQWTAFRIAEILVFASPFVFIQALIVFYVIVYPIATKFELKKFLLGFILIAIAYVLQYLYTVDISYFSIYSYDNVVFLVSGWLMVFLWGVYLGSEKIQTNRKNNWLNLVLAISSLVIIYGQRYLILKGHTLSFQIVQQIMMVALIHNLITWATSSSLLNNIRSAKIKQVVDFISGITLELYIVHVALLSFFGFDMFTFPVGLILFLTISIIMSTLFYRIRIAFTNSLSAAFPAGDRDLGAFK